MVRRSSARARRRPRWWLRAKDGNGRVEFLTTDRDGDGGQTSAVFGREEQAEMFLRPAGYGDDGWHARESSTGEPYSGAESVAFLGSSAN